MQKSVSKKFEDLYIWQKARELVAQVYDISKEWKDFDLKNQIRRASVSVLSNISEGFERGTKKEFIQFLYISRGSCGEVRAQLYVAYDFRYIAREDFERVLDLSDYESRLIYNFIQGFKQKGFEGQKFEQ